MNLSIGEDHHQNHRTGKTTENVAGKILNLKCSRKNKLYVITSTSMFFDKSPALDKMI